jgi:uncharacterized damage-inducible protein DinB
MPGELEVMLYESNFDPWESVSSILNHSGERAERLKTHILETKLMYWNLICSTLNLEPPPTSLLERSEALEMSLLELMHFECRMTSLLSVAQLMARLEYSGRELSVAALIRLSIRHSVWHAGQIALTRF